MTLSEENRRQLVKHYVEKAKTTVENVSFLIKNKKFFMAANRIYYGIYYMLSALAVKHQFSTSKHTQLIGWFNKKDRFCRNRIIQLFDVIVVVSSDTDNFTYG